LIKYVINSKILCQLVVCLDGSGLEHHAALMANISINGISYNAIEIDPLDRMAEHALIKPLTLDPGTLAWLRPTSINVGKPTKRPLALRGPDGREVVFVDRRCELVLCIEKHLHPQHAPLQGKSAMKTSDIRKNALRVAYELYENCSGELRHSLFDLDEETSRFGNANEADAQAIYAYLTSTGIMESPYIGSGNTVKFSDYGISVIESGIDRPNDASGPFPPLNVVIGDIGAGAQVAIGSGNFTQTRHDTDNTQLLRDLVPLLQLSCTELNAAGREQEATLLAAAKDEADGENCNVGFLRSLLGRFARKVGDGAVDAGSVGLLAYCRAHGLLP
jgi:hypothetical protein